MKYRKPGTSDVEVSEISLGCVIPGFRNERQVACNLAAAGRVLSKEDEDFIRAVFAE